MKRRNDSRGRTRLDAPDVTCAALARTEEMHNLFYVIGLMIIALAVIGLAA